MDFDVFTDEINFSKPLFKNLLNRFVKEIPATPNGPNYESGRKLYANECLALNDEAGSAFYFSESLSATLRTMTIYREEQLKASGRKTAKIQNYIRPVKKLLNSQPETKTNKLDFVLKDDEDISNLLKKYEIDDLQPFHIRYLKFTDENNVNNFLKILKELPKEWTIVQVTAPYNPNENLKPYEEYKKEISSIFVSAFTNHYADDCDFGPITVEVAANVIKEGERPLFDELYMLLKDNLKTIENAQYLNTKQLVQNYWSRREDIDLRMKGVINIMNKDWLGGWTSLLTGKLRDVNLKNKIVEAVDTVISDWGFIKLTKKQKILLYNLIESSPVLTSHQIKYCIKRILTEYGKIDDVRQVLSTNECSNCTKEYRFLNELCFKCQLKGFEMIHQFAVSDGIRAFSELAKIIKEEEEWSCLKKAKRYPVILIVDEMLDTFPWESLPILSHHPVCRIENIHVLYYLYKIHEKDIVDGYFAAKSDVGRYIINPEKNLERMEKRMTSFVNYWCNSWSGHVGEIPKPEDYVSHLTQADIFLYCGHGHGCNLANGASNGAGVEGARGGRAVTVLSGCGSVRLTRPPGRGPGAGAHHHLHIAHCPMVIGMLWEVTDLEIDKVVSTLVSLYVPSSAQPRWPSVGKAKWSQGELDTNVEDKVPFVPERDILTAVSRARGSTSFVMIASSVVARGLPIRIMQDS